MAHITTPVTEVPVTEDWNFESCSSPQAIEEWFQNFVRNVKMLVHTGCNLLQKALSIFEQQDYTQRHAYRELRKLLRQLWMQWQSYLVGEKNGVRSALHAAPLEFDFTSARELCETQHADRGMAGVRRRLTQLKLRADVLLSFKDELEMCSRENGTYILIALSEEVDLLKIGGDDNTEVLLALPDAVVPELTAEVVQRLAAEELSEQEDEEPLEGRYWYKDEGPEPDWLEEYILESGAPKNYVVAAGDAHTIAVKWGCDDIAECMLDPVYAYSTRKMVVRGYQPVELALVGEAFENRTLPAKLVRKYIFGIYDDENDTDDTDDTDGEDGEV